LSPGVALDLSGGSRNGVT